jgi:hypothetical protein
VVYVEKATGAAGVMRIDFDGTNIRFYVYGGFGSTWSGGLGWDGWVNGVYVTGTTPWPMGSHSAPGILFGGPWAANYGTQTVTFQLFNTGTSGLGGPTTLQMNVTRTPPASVPAAPTWDRVENVTTTGFRLYFKRGAANGATITAEQAEYYTNPGMTGTPHWINNISNGSYTDPSTHGNLSPGTTYYIRLRSQNSVGWSAWSSTWTQSTLPSSPPTLSVSSSPSGLSALVVVGPPGGSTGVTSYDIERRIGASGSVTSFNTTATSNTVINLTPGTTYQWRARANFGASYSSPFTSWISETQENPSTSPGDYFDGNTTDTQVQQYQWGTDGSGTPDNSVSTALGFAPTGWEIDTFAGSTAVLMRAQVPRFGSYGARVIFTHDATGAGVRIGLSDATSNPTGRSDVTGLTTYTGSMYVMVSRYQRMQAEITWMQSNGTLISRSLGTPQIVNSGVWTRLSVTADSPVNAEWASVRVIDVTGSGHSNWLAGEWINLDAAMLTLGQPIDYFDGSFPDDSTYDYAWTGTANASTSTRTPQTSSTSDEIVDPDCIMPPPPPRPPTVPDDCIEDTTIWRRYTYEIQPENVSDWLDVLPTFRLRTFPQQPAPAPDASVRQVRIRIYPNPFGYAADQVDYSNWCSEQIVSYIPADTVLTLDGELQRAFAEVRGGAMQAADHLLYGTGGTPATWPVLTCGIPYVVTLDVPATGDSAQLHTDIFLTRRT